MEKMTFYMNQRYKQFLLRVKQQHGVPQVETLRRALDAYHQQHYPDINNGSSEPNSGTASPAAH